MSVIHVGEFAFECETDIERYRADTLFTKEEGTVRWLRAQCKSGDIVYDIGANIGIYTVIAARLVCPNGIVYAFEPHAPTAAHLTQNVLLNGQEKLVRVKCLALHSSQGYFQFNYTSHKPGSSGHQLGHLESESGQEFKPVASEVVQAVTIDALIQTQAIDPADLVKLDVDGNELKILYGMRQLFTKTPPRSVQIEMHPQDDAAIVQFMEGYTYRLKERHYTALGKEAIAKGRDPRQIAHNAIFEI